VTLKTGVMMIISALITGIITLYIHSEKLLLFKISVFLIR